MNKLVDSLPGRPAFQCSKIVVGGETLEVWHRDIIECLRALYGDPEFSPHLVFIPERHYADEDETVRVFGDMHTGKWWWEMQVRTILFYFLRFFHVILQQTLEKTHPGATIIPVMISSDKTQLTLFQNKAAYPVYITIGNLPKDIRRKPSHQGQILLGYLPTSKLENFPTKAGRRRALINLFHACIARILEPLKEAGVEGVNMKSGDGALRRTHPIFAVFVGDYPEQLLVTCCKNMCCPKCAVDPKSLGDGQMHPLRNVADILDALGTLSEGGAAYSRACLAAGIKPVYKPFWQELPYVNVFQSITPDILHQMYQGIIKHLLSWLKSAFGGAEIDARCQRLPPQPQPSPLFKGHNIVLTCIWKRAW